MPERTRWWTSGSPGAGGRPWAGRGSGRRAEPPWDGRGDFSQILQTDGTQLYDPYSGVLTGTTFGRTALPGNQIPASRISSIAARYLKFYPQPNVSANSPTSRPNGYYNYGSTATSTNNADNEMGQLDYNMSPKSRMSMLARHNALNAKKNGYFKDISSGILTRRENWGGSLDEVYLLNSTNILNVRLNYTYMFESSTDPSVGAVTIGYATAMNMLHRTCPGRC